MQVIDMHLHLNNKLSTAVDCIREISEGLTEAGIDRGLLLHLQQDRFSVQEISSALKNDPRVRGFVNINPHDTEAALKLRNAISELGFVGLKLHPRLDNYDLDDPKAIELAKVCKEIRAPICIDAFPDGYSLQRGFQISQLAAIATALGDVPLIVGHMGGIYCLEMMLLAKRIPNIYMNIAYTLLYFRGSSVTQDLIYCINSLRGKRVFYGSDYPDRGITETLKLSIAEFEKFGLSREFQENVLFKNADEFWSKWLNR